MVSQDRKSPRTGGRWTSFDCIFNIYVQNFNETLSNIAVNFEQPAQNYNISVICSSCWSLSSFIVKFISTYCTSFSIN